VVLAIAKAVPDVGFRSVATLLGSRAAEPARLVEEAPDGKDWLHEVEYDGYRMHARISKGL
jgi:ATP-dependent DNA ligase